MVLVCGWNATQFDRKQIRSSIRLLVLQSTGKGAEIAAVGNETTLVVSRTNKAARVQGRGKTLCCIWGSGDNQWRKGAGKKQE